MKKQTWFSTMMFWALVTIIGGQLIAIGSSGSVLTSSDTRPELQINVSSNGQASETLSQSSHAHFAIIGEKKVNVAGRRRHLSRWDGCQGKVRAIRSPRGRVSVLGENSYLVNVKNRNKQYVEAQCGHHYIDKKFQDHLESNFTRCVGEGLDQSGLSSSRKIDKILAHVSSSHRNSRVAGTRRWSKHAYGRALDLTQITVIEAGTEKPISLDLTVRAYKRQSGIKEFYDRFRVCWRDSLPKNCIDKKQFGSIGIPGSTRGGFFNNRSHGDHLHLDYGICASKGKK